MNDSQVLPLRDYQQAALDAIAAAERAGVQRQLVVAPTGSGKTVTFSHLVAGREGRAIILVHRDELVRQATEKIGRVAPSLEVGVVKAERDEHDADVVVASIQTASRRLRLARLSGFSTVIADEAHHAASPSWRSVLEHLGSFRSGGPLTVGFTATPETDGRAPLREVWQDVVHYTSIRDLVYQDRLVVPVGQTVATSADLSSVHIRKGDLVEAEVGEEMTRSGAISEVADAYVRYAKDRKGIAFTPTVETAHLLARELVSAGVTAEALDGTTPAGERQEILGRLRSGATQVVANCAVLTEGFDEPSIDCVVIARPTKFHGLYVQMVGRGLRKHPGKTDCLILDVCGAAERHDLVSVVDLGIEKKEEEGAPRAAAAGAGQDDELCRRCGRPVSGGRLFHDTCQAKRTAVVDPFATSKLQWLAVEDGWWCLPTGDRGTLILAPDEGDTWQLIEHKGQKRTVLHRSLPLDWAQGLGEDRAKAFGHLAKKNASWRNLDPTAAQLGFLRRAGLSERGFARVRTRGQASDLIARIQARTAIRRMTKGQ